MKQLFILSVILLVLGGRVHAAESAIGEDNKPAASQPAKAESEEGAGGDLQQEASLTGSRMSHGFSWRNTQARLMEMKLVGCKPGGPDARTSIPQLEAMGFCNVKGQETNPAKLPKGTVWVYGHMPHGNSVIKTG